MGNVSKTRSEREITEGMRLRGLVPKGKFVFFFGENQGYDWC